MARSQGRAGLKRSESVRSGNGYCVRGEGGNVAFALFRLRC